MNIIKSEKHITIYPTVKEGLFKNYGYKEATVLKSLGKKVNILHRRHNGSEWHMVQMQMDKKDFQTYIDELQALCDELEE